MKRKNEEKRKEKTTQKPVYKKKHKFETNEKGNNWKLPKNFPVSMPTPWAIWILSSNKHKSNPFNSWKCQIIKIWKWSVNLEILVPCVKLNNKNIRSSNNSNKYDQSTWIHPKFSDFYVIARSYIIGTFTSIPLTWSH